MEEERWSLIFDRCLRTCEGKDTVSRFTKHIFVKANWRRNRTSPCPWQSKLNSHPLQKLRVSLSSLSISWPLRLTLVLGPGLSDENTNPLTAEEIAKNVQALKSRMKPGRTKSGRSGTASPSPSNSPARKTPSGVSAKLMRKWGDSGSVNENDMAALDYSAPQAEETSVDVEGLVSDDAMGVRGKDGNYEVADWDYRGSKRGGDDLPSEEEILARGTSKISLSGAEEKVEEKSGGWGSMFARLTGKKVLTEEDLRPVLVEMERHLMSKNVAKDIAEKMCDSVGAALVGKKLGGLTSMSEVCLVD
jgi:signal recognition particle receptor subunit alpha